MGCHAFSADDYSAVCHILKEMTKGGYHCVGNC